MGGMLVLFAAGLWTARGHLQGVLRKAILGAPEVDDSTEILSYRAALFALVGGSLSMAGWLWLVGRALIMLLLLLRAGATRGGRSILWAILAALYGLWITSGSICFWPG